MDIDKILSQWNQNFVGHDIIWMPPTWKSEIPVPYTFVYTDSELSCEEYAGFYNLCVSERIANPRIFTPCVMEFSSLFHTSFFHSLKHNAHKHISFTERINSLQINHPVSQGIEVATVKYYLQSLIFLTGVTLSAAIVQNRWSPGTLDSKLNRLWQAGKSVESAGIKELEDLKICEFVLKTAQQLENIPLKALFNLKMFFSRILGELVTTIPCDEAYIETAKLDSSQKLKYGFVDQLKSMLGTNIRSIILYGSATISEKFSDYDIIIVVKNLKNGLEKLAGKSPTFNGLELNISLFGENDFWAYQLASGDNLMDHAVCLYGETRIPHKPTHDLLARNFSFGFIRFRQLLGMAACVNNFSKVSDDKQNLLNYFIKIPLNVSKGIQGCYGKITTNEEIKKWFIENLEFDVDFLKECSQKGNHIGPVSSAAWATQKVMNIYNKQLNLYSVLLN